MNEKNQPYSRHYRYYLCSADDPLTKGVMCVSYDFWRWSLVIPENRCGQDDLGFISKLLVKTWSPDWKRLAGIIQKDHTAICNHPFIEYLLVRKKNKSLKCMYEWSMICITHYFYEMLYVNDFILWWKNR